MNLPGLCHKAPGEFNSIPANIKSKLKKWVQTNILWSRITTIDKHLFEFYQACPSTASSMYYFQLREENTSLGCAVPSSGQASTSLALIRALFSLIDLHAIVSYEFNFGAFTLLLWFGMLGLVSLILQVWFERFGLGGLVWQVCLSKFRLAVLIQYFWFGIFGLTLSI